MQRLSARHIGELAQELEGLFRGRELVEVQALPPRDLLLIFAVDEASSREPGGRPKAVRRLRLSADPDAPRAHLQHDRVHSYDGPSGPFFLGLAEELRGLTLKRLEQVSEDRILRLVFEGEQRRGLIAELGGRNGNLILTDGGGMILDLLVQPSNKASRERAPRLVLGSAWSRPPGKPPADTGEGLLASWPEANAELPRLPVEAPYSRRVEGVLTQSVVERDRSRDRRDLLQRLKRQLASAIGLLSGLEKRRIAAEGAERVRMDGDLLKSNLQLIKRGDEEVEVSDWFDEGAQRKISLDPKLTPQENLKRIFNRYQKLSRSGDAVEREIGLAEERRALLVQFIERAEETGAETLEEEAVASGVLPMRLVKTHRDKQATSQRLPYRKFIGCRGSEIRVGRSARDNDQMNSRYSRGNDLWLHTRDAPGSHVILRIERGKQADSEEILDAAHLALYFSPLKNAGGGSIHVAPRKQVHKPKGAPPGLVTLSGGKTLELRVEPERLRRLLGSANRPG